MRLNILLALAHLSLAHENFTTEETPFTIKDDLFSTEEMSPMSPSSDHFAAEPPQPQGPPTSVLPDAEPPGIQPQPPGEQESLNLKSSQRTSGKRSESERTTTTTAQYGDSIGVSSAVSSADNEEMHNELLESSGEMKRGLSAAPTIINTDEKEGSGTDLASPLERVLGDPVGGYESILKQIQDFADDVKEVDDLKMNTSLVRTVDILTKPDSGVESLNVSAEVTKSITSVTESNMGIRAPSLSAPPKRGAVEGCPTPEVCTQNCFVYINDQGCQDCQCLWQALACDFDEDCPESAQFCDLGRCNCRPGLRQDMKHSGSCEQDPDFKESTENGDVHPPAPPPSLGHVSRMLIDRTIDGTFPNLPPLQPFTKLISEPVPAKNKTVKEIGKQKGR
ncbi:unnamed protein product [Nippostrongylus brasiliensis]|uniref:TIL domain-containing protein n=1 Tax=Nippostrongylus brasiliensis TaxID=27835 RepID=A0A0N4XWG5_NIPBR|nr:unnamed protein product [Nippostrongylus brasiliensis]